MNNNEKKAIVLALLFTIAFSFFAQGLAMRGDYKFHYEKAKNGCEPNDEACKVYAPLFHFIAQPFTFHEKAFFYFTILLFAFITPMLLFYITKNWISVWFYFSTNAYYWGVLDGIFSQGITVILLLLLIALEDRRIRLGIVILSIFSHGHGFFLILLSYIILEAWNIVKDDLYDLKEKASKKLMKLFISCTGFFGNQGQPEFFKTNIDQVPLYWQTVNVGNMINIFTKMFPFPYFYFSVRKLLRKKESMGLLILGIVFLILGFWIQQRVFYLIPIVLLPGLTWYYEDLSKNHKILFILSTFFVFGFQLYLWLNIKFSCV